MILDQMKAIGKESNNPTSSNGTYVKLLTKSVKHSSESTPTSSRPNFIFSADQSTKTSRQNTDRKPKVSVIVKNKSDELEPASIKPERNISQDSLSRRSANQDSLSKRPISQDSLEGSVFEEELERRLEKLIELPGMTLRQSSY